MIDNLKKINLFTYMYGNKVIISHTEFLPGYTFACYLYDDEGNIVKKWRYQKEHSFNFDLSSSEFINKNITSLRYFIKNNKNLVKGRNFNIKDNLYIKVDDIDRSIFTSILKNKFEFTYHRKQYLISSESFIDNKLLILGDFQGVQFVNWSVIWEDFSLKSRTWQWLLHSFVYIRQLISHHFENKDYVALDNIIEAINSWTEYYFDRSDYSFEFIWHDHATALRAENILLFIYYIDNYEKKWKKMQNKFFDKLDYVLYVIGKKLEQESFYTKHTNHGLEQVRVLLLLGTYFNQKNWIEIAKQRLNSELDYAFTEEGIHRENSPSYHQFVFKIFLRIMGDYPKGYLGKENSKFSRIAPKALEYLTYILRPDGKLPIIGDTELKPTTDGYVKYFADISPKIYNSFLYSFSQGKQGTKPLDRVKVYSQSGYAIYRDAWHDAIDFKNTVHMIFKTGCLSRYHHQQDENNLVLYAYAEDWLIDSGLYKYMNKDPIRQYMRRRQAHNVPILSNCNYSSDFNHRMNSWRLSYFLKDDLINIKGVNTVLQNIEHCRELQLPENFNTQEKFEVVDEINILDAAFRDVSFLWHIPADKKVEIINGNQIQIQSLASGKILLLTVKPKPHTIVVNKGIVNNRVFSCVSNEMGKIQDSWVVSVNYKDIKKINVKNTFSFYKN